MGRAAYWKWPENYVLPGGVGGLVALAIAYLGLHAWLSRGHLYDPAGKPTFYWGLTPQGTIHKQSEPGLNPYTQKPLLPASAEYLALIRTRPCPSAWQTPGHAKSLA